MVKWIGIGAHVVVVRHGMRDSIHVPASTLLSKYLILNLCGVEARRTIKRWYRKQPMLFLRHTNPDSFYNAVGQEDPDPFHRYVVEQGFKPAIFGSYNYDPIRQVFEYPKRERNDSLPQIFNESYVLSTAVGTTDEINFTDTGFRHHILRTTRPSTAWWARKLKVNVTKKRII